MKKITPLLLLIVLSALLYISREDFPASLNEKPETPDKYFRGILKTELPNLDERVKYNIDVDYISDTKSIAVKEEILWINKTSESAKELQFHFYANAYKSSKTLFAQAFKLNKDSETEIDLSRFEVNGTKSELIFFQPEIDNPHDSTVAKAILDKPVFPGESVKIFFEYKMKIPRSVKRMGYAAGRNFSFVSQWFPKIGVFENGKWVCSQYHPYLNYYSDFGDYSVNIRAPKNYIVGATGVEVRKTYDGNNAVHQFVQKGVIDFVWFASDEILHKTQTYSRKDGSVITINAYIQPEREKYGNRYFECVKNCLSYFEENVGIYPYQNVSLVDVPRTSASGGMEYPTLFTVGAELFSPKETGQPEYLVSHEFSHQFFQSLIANNEVYEAWLDEGFTSYISTKIMYHYYPDQLENFKFAVYIPVFGLNFLSYNEIPVIYTLVDVKSPLGAKSAASYYKNLSIGALADTSYKLPTRLSYVVNSYSKPELMLHTLERYVGRPKMMKILKEYYDKYKYRHPTASDFITIVKNNCAEDMNWFFDQFYRSSNTFDYKVSSVKRTSNKEYEVLVERLGEGIFKNDIVLYTDKETLFQKWDGKERWKILKFKTENTVYGAEIDPLRKNLLDLNFANNSFTAEPRVWASLSLAIRFFFWTQNALMILGSVG